MLYFRQGSQFLNVIHFHTPLYLIFLSVSPIFFWLQIALLKRCSRPSLFKFYRLRKIFIVFCKQLVSVPCLIVIILFYVFFPILPLVKSLSLTSRLARRIELMSHKGLILSIYIGVSITVFFITFCNWY